MKLCGIIAEFNPFTNGHKYLIEKVKEQTTSPIAVIMSGNMVQRGELACLDKYSRAKTAALYGASFVIELPVIYSLSSAENFAFGAVKYLGGLGISELAFGVDNLDADFEEYVNTKLNEPSEVKNAIKNAIKNGESYSVAMFNAYTSLNPKFEKIFSSANNLLAAEYLYFIKKLGLDIKPILIERSDNGYNSIEPKTLNKVQYVGATFIRELINKANYKQIKNFVPPQSFEEIKLSSCEKSVSERLDAILLNDLRNKEKSELNSLYDFNPSLSNVIYENARNYGSVEEIINNSVSKCHRKSRVKRAILMNSLNITKNDFKNFDKNLLPINVLAIRKDFKTSMSKLLTQSKVKLVVSTKDYDNLSENEKGLLLLNQKATDLRNIVYSRPQRKDKTIFV